MLLALALTAHVVAAAPSAKLSESVPVRGFSARLLAQADAPAPESATDLQLRLDDLSTRIRAHKTDWPVGAIVLAYLGFSLAGLLLPGIPLTLLGLFAAGSEAGALLLAIGLGVLALGVVGLIAGIAGLLVGSSAAAEAKATRQDLIQERDELQRRLDAMKARPPTVEHDLTPQSLLTLAVF